jgi:hypothetical protein
MLLRRTSVFPWRWRHAAMRGALLVAGSLAALAPLPLVGQEVPSQFRSLTDVRPRIPDEHYRPYFRDTQSHRGWEIREDRFTIFASTSREDAQWAAAQVAQAWQNAARLADRWTQVHHNPDFGLNALQIAIDNEPLRDRDAPLTTVNVVGIQAQIQINVAPGQPPLAQQVVRLREAAGFAMLHADGLDSAAPPWVVAGLAAYAGRQGLSAEELQSSDAVKPAADFGGQQWRYKRAADDVLDYRRPDQNEARQRVAFLLTGDDAEHAPAFLAALAAANSDAARRAAEGNGFMPFPGNERLAPTNTPFDKLAGQFHAQYDAWKEDPLTGQPLFKPAADAPAELLAAEREMLVLLKLERRFARADSVAPSRAKIVTFDRAKGATTEPAKRSVAMTSFPGLARRLTDPAHAVWGTLDVDGSVLLSTDVERVSELLGGIQPRYSLEQQQDHSVLVRQLDAYWQLRGWLEDNRENKARPLAKFEVVDRRTKEKADQPAEKDKQVSNLPQ